MIAENRGSQIADRRRSQRELFPYNGGDHERSQSRLLPTFRSAEVSKLQALCAGGKIASILIITVTAVNALISRNFLHIFFVTNVA